MEFRKEKPECKFEVPDKPTVRQQLAYFSASASVDGDNFLERSWQGAKNIIIQPSWKCAVMADINADLDKLTDSQATEIVLWAGMEVRKFMNELDTLPKN